MIEIQDLQDLTKSDILDLLLDQGKQPFSIYVPKETLLFHSESSAIAEDYAHLAYAGHLLAEVAGYFSYEEVSPEEAESALFEVESQNLEQLADTLLFISYGYVNDHPDDPEFNFSEHVGQYFYELENGIIKEVACPYFVETAEEFIEEEEGEDESEDEELI